MANKTGWEDLGGAITSAPTAVAWASNRLDLIARGTTGAVFHKVWNGAEWQPSKTDWEEMGGMASWAPNRLDVVVHGKDGAAYHISWDGFRWLPS